MMIVALGMSLIPLFAEGNSCKVSGDDRVNGEVILVNNNAQSRGSKGNAQVSTSVRFKGTSGNVRTVNVMVYLYDAQGNYVTAQSVTVQTNGVTKPVFFDNVKENTAYRFKVSDATCQ